MDSAQSEAMIRYMKEKILRKPDLAIDADYSAGLLRDRGLVRLVEALFRVGRITKLRIPRPRLRPPIWIRTEKMFETAGEVGQAAEIVPSTYFVVLRFLHFSHHLFNCLLFVIAEIGIQLQQLLPSVIAPLASFLP